MTHPNEESAPNGPAALASSLVETLEEERASLTRMHDQFDRQIAAIRDRDDEEIERVTLRTNDEVNILARLKQARDRQIRLLGRILRIEGEVTSLRDISDALMRSADTASVGERVAHLREQVRGQAQATQERCRDLEFAIQYAVHLGRELLQAVQGIDTAAGGKHYTSKGGMVESQSSNRSFLNKIG